MEEFEVHLLSTASMNIFGDNTLASFKNQLPQNISLEGDWRVALSEIIFPSKINNVYTDFFYHAYNLNTRNVFGVEEEEGVEKEAEEKTEEEADKEREEEVQEETEKKAVENNEKEEKESFALLSKTEYTSCRVHKHQLFAV